MNWADIAGIATPIAVLIAAWEVRQTNKTSIAQYEDAFEREYRVLAMIIPMDAFLGKTLDDPAPEVREAIYNYFDLTNDQAHQYSKGRISRDTWESWSSGILANMRQPAFKKLWQEVQEVNTDTFTYLANLLIREKLKTRTKNS